jgi:serine/threonine protein kinase
MTMTSETEPTRARTGPGSTALSPAPRRVLAGRYELDAVLGHGGVGTVHRARDVVLDRSVAVKVFRHDATIPDLAGRYTQEARLLASLSHPGLVTVFDAGIDSSAAPPNPYLVMELVEGTTLAERLADGPIPTAQTCALGAQLATALAYVHRRGVVHRDVKPANILLPAAEDAGPVTAKLTDFGIARLVDGVRVTVHGLTLGTPNYLSPEQTTGDVVGPPADVYALGLVLLECVTGQVAYPGQGIEAAVIRLHKPPAFPTWLDPELTRLLVAMTHRDPAQRPSAAAAAAALSNVAAGAPGPSASAVAGAPTLALPPVAARGSTRPLQVVVARRPRRRWLLAAALLVAALIVVVVVIATHRSRTPATSTVRPPAYPSVPGQLGTDLRQLQGQVQP